MCPNTGNRIPQPHRLLKVLHTSDGHFLMASHGHDDESRWRSWNERELMESKLRKGDRGRERQRAQGEEEKEASGHKE